MKTNIKYSIFDLILSIIVLSISLIGFIVLVTACHFWGSVGYFIFFLIATIMLLHSIKNIQWIDITDGYITVHCPFGIIRRVRLNQIKKAFKTNAVIYSIKMLSARRPHIVLCIKKSVAKAGVDDAYNGKKKPYIIIPYSTETEVLICTEYKKLCGEELIIK
ncbi:MAG: hypothetical protein J6V34_00145 [Oscillospiraceae bacterium]|nr:hypothetical protein [Bacteroidaceae bacterium]MBO7184194.1 hypothetical protein [Oscillospiraceae bacterium]